MALVLFSGTRGSDDPTRAALPLLGASGTLEAGHQAEVFLLGEAVYLMKNEVAHALQPVAFPNVGELIRALVGEGIRFYV